MKYARNHPPIPALQEKDVDLERVVKRMNYGFQVNLFNSDRAISKKDVNRLKLWNMISNGTSKVSIVSLVSAYSGMGKYIYDFFNNDVLTKGLEGTNEWILGLSCGAVALTVVSKLTAQRYYEKHFHATYTMGNRYVTPSQLNFEGLNERIDREIKSKGNKLLGREIPKLMQDMDSYDGAAVLTRGYVAELMTDFKNGEFTLKSPDHASVKCSFGDYQVPLLDGYMELNLVRINHQDRSYADQYELAEEDNISRDLCSHLFDAKSSYRKEILVGGRIDGGVLRADMFRFDDKSFVYFVG